MRDLINENIMVAGMATLLLAGEDVIEDIEEELLIAMTTLVAYVSTLAIANKWTDKKMSKKEVDKISDELDKKLSKIFDAFVRKERKMMNKGMVDLASQAYDLARKNVNFNDKKVLNEQIKRNLAQKLAKSDSFGLKISERVAAHNVQLHLDARKRVIDGIINGRSQDDIVNDLQQLHYRKQHEIERLVRTETARFYNEATKDVLLMAGMRKARFTAVLDERTSAICESLHGNVYDIDSLVAGTNMPPMHPNCRSTIVPVTV